MRTTLTIDDDVLAAARERARREHRSVGQVVSGLARRGLTEPWDETGATRHGFPVLPPSGNIVTNELIDRLREEAGV